jgi:hypothetical protein
MLSVARPRTKLKTLKRGSLYTANLHGKTQKVQIAVQESLTGMAYRD